VAAINFRSAKTAGCSILFIAEYIRGSVAYTRYIRYMAIGTSIGPIHGQLCEKWRFFSIFGRFEAVAAGRFRGVPAILF